MRSGQKISRGFLSEQTHRQLQVVRPYWVARNFIPQIIKSKCNGNHDVLKLPLIKDFLKRGHYKMFTESNISRQQISQLQKMSNHKYPSEYQYLNDNKETLKTKIHHNIKHNSILDAHNLQTKTQRQNNNYNQIFSKQQQSFRHKSKFQQSNTEICLRYQQQYVHRNKSLASGKESLFHLPQLRNINKNSQFNNPRIFSPVLSDRSIIQYQRQKAEELQNQNVIIKRQKQNRSISKLLMQHTLLKQERFSILGKKQKQKQKSDTSSIIDYDKTTLLQQYAMTANILQATLIKQQKFLNQNTSKKIMTLMATLSILKNNLQSQGLKVVLERYLPGVSTNIIKSIQKVLQKSIKYQQILKQISEKFQGRNIVIKKIQRSSIQNINNNKRILKNTDRYLTTKLLNQQNKQNKNSSFHKLKQHYRHQSDSIMMSKYKHEEEGKTKQQLAQIQLNRERQNKKYMLNKKNTDKQIPQNVSNKKSHHKNKLSLAFSKNKKISNEKISKGKLKKNTNQIKNISKQLNKFDKDKLERIRNINKNKNKRPKSHRLIRRRTDGQNINKSIQSQKVIMGFTNRKPVRASFKKYIQSQKDSYSRKAKTATNNNSKYQSSITTPELILQIEDPSQQPKIEEKQLQQHKQQDQESSNQENTLIKYKHINKAKINRFKMNLYDDIRLPSQNSEQQQQQQEQIFQPQIKKRITVQYGQEIDWNGIVRRVPKKKIKKINIQNEEKNKTREMYQLNGRIMLALHRQVYRILDDRDIPQLQEIRNILLQNQRKIVQSRLKQQYIPESSNANQQKWIQGLDFGIKINTNNRQHLGGMRHAKVIVRNDAQSDPVQLYQIALRQIQISERLQQKQRLQIFAKQSVNILQKSHFNNEVYSYGF